jgi:hypothetical protein
MSGRPADTACWGRCHAPIKSRRNIPDRRRATQRKVVRPNGRQPERESARAGRGAFTSRRTSPTKPDRYSTPDSASPVWAATECCLPRMQQRHGMVSPTTPSSRLPPTPLKPGADPPPTRPLRARSRRHHPQAPPPIRPPVTQAGWSGTKWSDPQPPTPATRASPDDRRRDHPRRDNRPARVRRGRQEGGRQTEQEAGLH